MTGTLMRRNIASALATSSTATSWGVVTSSAPRDRHRLGEGQLGVGRARRQVDHQVVELAPVDVAQELLDRAADERPAPDDRLALGHEELDRDDLDAVALERRDLALRAGGRRTFDAEHQRDVGAGDVRVEQADRRALHAPARRRGWRETVVLPTPPLPDATAMMFLTPGSSCCACAGWARRTMAPQVIVTSFAPMPLSAACTLRSISSFSGQAGVVSSILSETSSDRLMARRP